MPELFPQLFAENMKRLLGDSFADFATSFGGSRKNALRVNRLRVSPAAFEASAPFPVQRVPWTDNGYYVDYRDRPGRHPLYRAGIYYLQEPSAMAPAQILPVSPGNLVLDLCAAPGGKATEIGARLAGEGILVANEISTSRVRALERNIELFGIRNCVVANEPPAKLAKRFRAYFDRVLVDAPCSGEGMFRKDPDAADVWSMEKVKECAAIQREIILQAADMLKPSGYMVYSTCTFEPYENELVIAYLLHERPEMELVEIPCTDGRETFSKAYTLQELTDRGFAPCMGTWADPEGVPWADSESGHRADPESGHRADPESGHGADPEGGHRTDPDTDVRTDLSRAVRIWPHTADGEGHFIALLRKKEIKNTDQFQGDGQRVQPSNIRRGRTAKPDRKQTTKQEKGSIAQTDQDLILQFLSVYASDLEIDINRIEVRNSHVYLMPEDCPDIKGLKFVRAGLYLGELKKNRFEPSQELALALPPAKRLSCLVMDDGIHILLSAGDEKLSAFLRGEPVRPENPGRNGWRLICADVYPVGWGKLVGGVLKNHIPPEWRTKE